MDTLQWLTETEFGKCIFTMLVSMVPIIELRGGLPFGVALGLPYHLAFPAAVLGNLIPAPFIIVYIRRIFEFSKLSIGQSPRTPPKMQSSVSHSIEIELPISL